MSRPVLKGELLRLEIARRGLNLKEFASRAKLSQSAINQAVNERPVNSATLRKIISGLQRFPPLEGSELVAMAKEKP